MPKSGSLITALLSSEDPTFRPRAPAAAPDGSLFFADGGKQDGRIYRITAQDRPLPELPSLANASPEQLLEALKSPEESVREQARHLSDAVSQFKLQEGGAASVASAFSAPAAPPAPAVAASLRRPALQIR